MEGISVCEVDTLVVEFVVADLQTGQCLPHDRLVEDVSSDALDYLPVFLLGQRCLHTWEVVDVEDRLRSFAQVFGRRKAFLCVDMTRLLGEALKQGELLLDADMRSIR